MPEPIPQSPCPQCGSIHEPGDCLVVDVQAVQSKIGETSEEYMTARDKIVTSFFKLHSFVIQGR